MLIAEEDHLPLQQHLAQEGVKGIFIMIAQRYVVDHGPNGQPKVLKAGANPGAQGLGRIGQAGSPCAYPATPKGTRLCRGKRSSSVLGRVAARAALRADAIRFARSRRCCKRPEPHG